MIGPLPEKRCGSILIAVDDTHPNHMSGVELFGYVKRSRGNVSSLIVLGLVKRRKISELPALSSVPLARAPPNVC